MIPDADGINPLFSKLSQKPLHSWTLGWTSVCDWSFLASKLGASRLIVLMKAWSLIDSLFSGSVQADALVKIARTVSDC